MGSDPKRLDGLSDDEAWAAVALEHVTGGVVRAHDVGRLQGAYDLDLLLPRGRRAAVEVTTHTGPGVRHHDSLLGPRLRGRAPAAPTTPVAGSTNGSRAPRADPSSTDGNGVSAAGAGLAAAVSELLLVPHLVRRSAKVAAVSGADERHLFVGLGEGGIEPGVYRWLGRPTSLPDDDPDVEEDGLTHLWLSTPWAGAPLVRWWRGHGWSVHDPGR